MMPAKRLQSSDYLVRLDCPHATAPTRRATVRLHEQGVSGTRSIWRYRGVVTLAIPSLDTWFPDTLRHAIREMDALLPAHAPHLGAAVLTLREWKTKSQKIDLTVTASPWRASTRLSDFEHGWHRGDEGPSGHPEHEESGRVWWGASEPMLAFLRRLSGRALTVAAFEVPVIHLTVAEDPGMAIPAPSDVETDDVDGVDEDDEDDDDE